MQWSSFLLGVAVAACIPCLPRAQTAQDWLTVLFMSKNSSWNARHLFDASGGINTGNDTERRSIWELRSVGEFRSQLIDQWAALAPTEARLALFSRSGDLLWHVTFPGHVPCSDTWLTASQVRASSSRHLLGRLYDLAFQFTTSSLRLFLRSTNQSYLFLEPPGGSSKGRFLFSTGGPQHLSPSTIISDSETMLRGSSPDNFTMSATWMKFIFTYPLYLLRLKVYKTSVGHVTSFRMSYTTESENNGLFQPLKTETGATRLFQPVYDAEGGALYDLDPVWVRVIQLEVLNWVGNHSLSIFFSFAPEGVLEAPYLAIQWRTEECFPDCVANQTQTLLSAEAAARELVQELTVPPKSTARYRRQFSSRSDQRGSAVMVGVVGGLVMALLVVGVVAMDISLFLRQARMFRENARHCRTRLCC